MKLFRYEGYNMTISEEALLLKPFKLIWNRDKSQKKEKALQELGYCYFMEDPRSDYQMYIDRNIRAEKIKEGEGLPKDWKPDKMLEEAMKFYSTFKPDAALLLEDTKKQVQKIRQLAGDIDLEDIQEVNDRLVALDKLTTITAKIPKLSIEIMEAEKRMNEEIQNADKIRGTVEKAMMEDD